MLAADKAFLNAELTTDLVRLREKELNFHVWHYNQLGIAASVLIGLALTFVTSERVQTMCVGLNVTDPEGVSRDIVSFRSDATSIRAAEAGNGQVGALSHTGRIAAGAVWEGGRQGEPLARGVALAELATRVGGGLGDGELEGWECDSAGTEALQICFSFFSVVAFSCFTQVCISTLMLSVLGPRLALHGPPGSMHRSVEMLSSQRRHTTASMAAGLTAFYVAAGIHPWIYHDYRVALPSTIMMCVAFLLTAISARALYLSFRVPKGLHKVAGYYHTDSFARGSMDEPHTPGRVIQTIQQRMVPHSAEVRKSATPPKHKLAASHVPAIVPKSPLGALDRALATWLRLPDSSSPHHELQQQHQPPAVTHMRSSEVMVRVDALEAQGLFNEAAELLAARMELLHQEAHEQKQPVKPPPVSRWHLVSPRTVASLVTPRSRAAKANPEPELGPPAGAGGGPLAEVTATVIAQCSDGAHTTAGGALTARGQPTTADGEDPRRHSAPAEDLRGTMGPPTMEWLKAGLGNLY